ncbi:MAG TPA: LuxR C-terminal-related transcriptional regulator [Mycobacteriales bacterium]|nr:LuxR C-terminal-related transcriptional regulator [Mycobacteriales bacterium]
MDDGRDTLAVGLADDLAEDLAGEFELRPLLERILRRSVELLGGDAGSICSVDEATGFYRKEADIGVSCQSGQVFPLTEGMTGAVVRARGPVHFADYRTVPGGHVTTEDRETLRGVVGVPILWRGGVVGACVVFSRDPERVFTRTDSARLELFARHAAIALANARLYQEAEAHARAEAAAAERDRLVREVHDTVAQGLASVIVHLDAAGREADPAEEIDQARQSAVTALAETRRTVLGLAPSPLEGRSLAEALQLELGWANRTGNLDVRLVEAGTPVALPDGLAHQLFRIAQEALTNAVRHAGARSVRIGVIHEDGTVAVLVQDDGQGFAADEATGSIGLRGMRERARLIGGTLEVDSLAGWGTRVRVSAPLDAGVVAAGRVRVLVAAPHPITRAGVVRLLAAGEPALQVAGEVDSVAAALDAYRLLAPAVVVAHLDLADPDGLAGVRAFRGLDPAAVVLVLCTRRDQELAAAAVRAGASGWLVDDATGTEMARALLAAAEGRSMVPAAALSGVADAVPLTDREREVFLLVRRGLRDKQIAERLVISVKTVEKHVGAVFRKTGARNRTELAALGEIPTIRTGSFPDAVRVRHA